MPIGVIILVQVVTVGANNESILHSRPENVVIENGMLKITARQENYTWDRTTLQLEF